MSDSNVREHLDAKHEHDREQRIKGKTKCTFSLITPRSLSS